MGQRVASTFTQRFNNVLSSGTGQAALAASKAFTLFFAKAQTGAVALSSLGGVISSLVSGLYLVGTAAASAGASLAALGGIGAVAAQGAITLGIAFKGVFKGISEGFKATKGGSEGAEKAVLRRHGALRTPGAASRTFRSPTPRRCWTPTEDQDAQQRLNDVTQQGAERKADAARKVADAERKLVASSHGSWPRRTH